MMQRMWLWTVGPRGGFRTVSLTHEEFRSLHGDEVIVPVDKEAADRQSARAAREYEARRAKILADRSSP
jgi:hypothetical protein